MFEQLKDIEMKYEELSQKLCETETVNDAKLYAQLMKEYKSLTPLVEEYRRYAIAQNSLEEALQLLDEPALDPDLKELAEEELKKAKKDIEKSAEELKILLLPKDPNDSKNVILEIRGGVGGEESALFAAVSKQILIEM